jgi:hypothetical protein
MWMRQQGLSYGISGVEDVERISPETPWRTMRTDRLGMP